jgi:hypothetical protein
VNIQVSESHGDAELALARKKAEQTIVVADAELARSRREAEQTVVLAEASAQRDQLAGRGESQKIAQVGLAEASVLLRQIASYGDPRLYALARVSENLSNSAQPLVPERMFVAGASSNGDGNGAAPNGTSGLLGVLISLLVAEKSGFQLGIDTPEMKELKAHAEKLVAASTPSVKLPEAPAAGAK